MGARRGSGQTDGVDCFRERSAVPSAGGTGGGPGAGGLEGDKLVLWEAAERRRWEEGRAGLKCRSSDAPASASAGRFPPPLLSARVGGVPTVCPARAAETGRVQHRPRSRGDCGKRGSGRIVTAQRQKRSGNFYQFNRSAPGLPWSPS